MTKTIKTINEKEVVVSEYLTSSTSYRNFGARYGIDFRMIHSWVMEYQGTNQKQKRTSSPEKLIATHHPKEKKWQLLNNPLKMKEFVELVNNR